MPFLAPLLGGLGGLIGGVTAFLKGGTMLAGIVNLGLGIAAQYAVGALIGNQTPAHAAQLETVYGEDLSRSVVFGKTAHAGHHIYRNAFSAGNRRIQDVYVLSHFLIKDVSRVRFEGEWRTLGGVEHPQLGLRVQGIDPEIWVKVYRGGMDQTADAELIARSNPAGRWTVNHRGTGVAYAVVTQQLDRDKLSSPWVPLFELEGSPLYDWRKDDTVGGSGSHRWHDQSTWEFSENPILMMYALERGIYRGAELMVGKGASASRLPIGEWTLAANICDENVEGIHRYKAAIIARSGRGSTHASNMTPLLEACAGSWLEAVGVEYPLAGANQAAIVTVTDGDLMIGEALRFAAKRPQAELVNTAAGSYLSPDAFYESRPLATRIDDVAVAEDRERLATSIPYAAVTDAKVADRLLDIAIRASRYQANAEICVKPKFITVKPGQWIRWTSLKPGRGDRYYQVVSRRLGPLASKASRAVYWTLQEVGDGIFDPTAYATTPPGGVPQGGPTYQSELQDLVVVGITVKDEESGKQYPAIRAAWTAIEDPTVIGVDFRYRLKAQPDIELPHPTVPDDVSLTTIANGVVSDTLYELSHRLVTSPFRQTPWTAWVEVLTPDTPPTDFVFPPGVVEDIEQWVNDQLDWLDEDSPLYPLGQDIHQIDQKVGVMEAELAGIVGAPDYDPLVTFNEGDLVAYDGGLYRALQTTTGNDPTNTTYWEKIGDYASLGDAVVALQARVSEAENEIERTQDGFRSTTRDSRRIYNAAIIPALLEVEKAGEAALEASDQFKATAAVGQWAETEIGRVDGVLTIHAADITRVQAGLEGKADVSVTQALQAAITQQGSEITSQGAAITSIQNALTGYTGAGAVSSAFTSLNTSVSNINGVVSAQATRTDDLFVAMGGSTNNVRAKFDAKAGPSGYSRLELVGRTTGFADRAASFGLDVPNNASLPSRTWVRGDQFLVLDGAGGLNALFDGDTAYFNNARLRNLTSQHINVQELVASSAFLDNLQVTSAMIGDLTVEEGNIAAGAITNQAHNTSTSNVSDAVWATLAQVTISSPSGNPVMVSYQLTSPSGFQYRLLRNGVPVTISSPFGMLMDAVPVGTHTYQAQMVSNGGIITGTGTLVAQCNKK